MFLRAPWCFSDSYKSGAGPRKRGTRALRFFAYRLFCLGMSTRSSNFNCIITQIRCLSVSLIGLVKTSEISKQAKTKSIFGTSKNWQCFAISGHTSIWLQNTQASHSVEYLLTTVPCIPVSTRVLQSSWDAHLVTNHHLPSFVSYHHDYQTCFPVFFFSSRDLQLV